MAVNAESTPMIRSGIARRCTAAILSMSAVMGPQVALPAMAATDPSCPDIQVVFARGTFEAPGVGATGQAFVDSLTPRLGGDTVDIYPVNYPASLDFQAAADGIIDASNKIEATAATCPATKIVFGGYSQGAAVAAYTTFDVIPPDLVLPDGITGPMPESVASHVAAVVLFGTPDNWFLNLVAPDAPPIVIGHLYAAKTIQLCASGDPVCFPGGRDRGAHSTYKFNGMADQAAAFAAEQLGIPGSDTTT
jgi:cutinase